MKSALFARVVAPAAILVSACSSAPTPSETTSTASSEMSRSAMLSKHFKCGCGTLGAGGDSCTCCDATAISWHHVQITCQEYYCDNFDNCESVGSPRVSASWSPTFAPLAKTKRIGDFDGDGRTDIVAFKKSDYTGAERGDVVVALSNGNDAFGAATKWIDSFCVESEQCVVGDFDGDGKSDIGRLGQDGDLRVALSTGASFQASTQWHPSFAPVGYELLVGDMNGDGRDDIVAVARGASGDASNDVWVGLSSGSAFGRQKWSDNGCMADCHLADRNGDGKADLVGFGYGRVTVYQSTGAGFGNPRSTHTSTLDAPVHAVVDVDRDGRADLIAQTTLGGPLKYVPATRSLFEDAISLPGLACNNPSGCSFADVNGDGHIDVIDQVTVSTAERVAGDVIVMLGASE
jgi:hypothetical protein